MQVSGFTDIGLLTPLLRLYPLPVRQTSTLPAASFRFRLATDTLAVQLTLPLAGRVEDFHLQVIFPATTAGKTAPVTALRAMPGAPTKKPRSSVAFFTSIEPRLSIRTRDDGEVGCETVSLLARSSWLFHGRRTSGKNGRKPTASARVGAKRRLMDNLGLTLAAEGAADIPQTPKPSRGGLWFKGSLAMTYFHVGIHTIIGAKSFHC